MDEITKYILEQQELSKMLENVRSYQEGYGVQHTVEIPKNVAGIAGAALAAMIIWKIAKMVSRIGDPKQCKDYKFGTPSYRLCLRKAKIQKMKKQIELLKSKSSLCGHAKNNVEKCKDKIKQKILILQQKIKEREGALK